MGNRKGRIERSCRCGAIPVRAARRAARHAGTDSGVNGSPMMSIIYEERRKIRRGPRAAWCYTGDLSDPGVQGLLRRRHRRHPAATFTISIQRFSVHLARAPQDEGQQHRHGQRYNPRPGRQVYDHGTLSEGVYGKRALLPDRDGSGYASAICASKLSEKATTSPRSGSGTLNVSSVTDKHRMNAA
jgi:hypothetical protein